MVSRLRAAEPVADTDTDAGKLTIHRFVNNKNGSRKIHAAGFYHRRCGLKGILKLGSVWSFTYITLKCDQSADVSDVIRKALIITEHKSRFANSSRWILKRYKQALPTNEIFEYFHISSGVGFFKKTKVLADAWKIDYLLRPN